MNEPSEQLDEAIENWRMGQFDQQIRFGSRLPSLPPADRVPGQPPRRPPVPADQAGKDGEVRELLETAQRVEALPALRPGAEFSRRLEQRLQTRADALRANGRRQRSRSLLATPAWLRVHRGWATVATLLITFVLLGVVGVVGAQASDPGNPFYGVKLFEQGVRLSLSSPADRVRLHISYAQADLSALQQSAVIGDESVFLQTLGYLDQETSAASSQLAALPGGTERDQLAQMMAQLTASEQQTLEGLLKQLTLTERVATTTELGKLGVAVPQIRSVTVTFGDDGKATVVIHGTGFEAGAMLLVDGQSVSAPLAVTPDEARATLALPEDMRPGTFGISNPDGTAAQSDQLTWADATPTPTSEPTGEPTHQPGELTPTPTPGGDHRTPTPTPQPSEMP